MSQFLRTVNFVSGIASLILEILDWECRSNRKLIHSRLHAEDPRSRNASMGGILKNTNVFIEFKEVRTC